MDWWSKSSLQRCTSTWQMNLARLPPVLPVLNPTQSKRSAAVSFKSQFVLLLRLPSGLQRVVGHAHARVATTAG